MKSVTRRHFLETATAAAAGSLLEVGCAEVGIKRKLTDKAVRLFGHTFLVDQEKKLVPPPGWYIPFATEFAHLDSQGAVAQLTFTHLIVNKKDSFCLDAAFSINVRRTGNTYEPDGVQTPLATVDSHLRVYDYDNSDPHASRLLFAIGGISVHYESTRVELKNVGDQTVLSYPALDILEGGFDDPVLPIALKGVQGAASLDIENETIALYPSGSFTCDVRTPTGDGRNLFVRTLNLSSGNQIKHQPGKPRAVLRFDVPDDIRVNCDFLNAKQPADLVVAACSISGQIELALIHQTSISNPQLVDLRAVAGSSLTLHALSAIDDLPPSLTLAEDLPLAVRPVSGGIPGSLILAPPKGGLAVTAQGFAKGFYSAAGSTEYWSEQFSTFTLHGAGIEPFAGGAIERVNKALLINLSGAVLHASSGEFWHARAGRQFSAAAYTFALDETYDFVPPKGLALSLLMPGHLARSATVASAVKGDIDAISAATSRTLRPVMHDTLRAETITTNGQQVVNVLSVIPDPSRVESGEELTLDSHDVEVGFGAFSIRVRAAAGNALRYELLWADEKNNKWWFELNQDPFTIKLCPAIPSLSEFSANLTTDVASSGHTLLGILKFSRDLTFADIISLENLGGFLPAGFADSLDANIASIDWTGLLMIRLAVNVPAPLKALLNSVLDQVTLNYLAITPSASSSSAVNTSGLIDWHCDTGEDCRPPTAAAYDSIKLPALETSIVPKRLYCCFGDNTLQAFQFEATITFDATFGQSAALPAPGFELRGSYDSKAQQLRFTGSFAAPQNILPLSAQGFLFESVCISTAVVVQQGADTLVSLSGYVELASLPSQASLASWFVAPTPPIGQKNLVQFSSLSIAVTEDASNPFRYKILYGDLRFDLAGAHFTHLQFQGLELALESLELRIDDAAEKIGFLPLQCVSGPFPSDDGFFVTLTCKLMPLPFICDLGIERLVLRIRLGIPRIANSAWDPKAIVPQIAFSGFENSSGFNLDFFRFLSLHATTFSLDVANGSPSYIRLVATGVSLYVLNKPVVDGITVVFFAVPTNGTDGGPLSFGMLGYFPDVMPHDGIWGFKIPWLMIGKNIAFSDATIPEAILNISSFNPDNPDLIAKIADGARNGKMLPGCQGCTNDTPNWLVAFGLNYATLFQGKFLYQDHGYIGVALYSELLDELLGHRFAVSILYVPGPTPSADEFEVSFSVPSITLPYLRLQGGVLRIALAMNGGFVLDAGFPWLLPNGVRDWSRAFGAIVLPFQGSGGIYIAYHALAPINPPDRPTRTDLLPLTGGYALQVGFGASWGDSFFRVWGTVGIYAVVEGTFWLTSPDSQGALIRGFELAGAVGVLIQAVAELDWWIISIRVSVTAGAEARLVLQWGEPYEPPHQGDIYINVSFTLYATASASACIGPRGFRVCRSIDVSAAMVVHETLRLTA